jgi:hypothetical protein
MGGRTPTNRSMIPHCPFYYSPRPLKRLSRHHLRRRCSAFLLGVA